MTLTGFPKNPSAGVNSVVSYSIRVLNISRGTARNVRVTDVLPDGLHYLDALPTAATQSDTQATWTFPSIGPRGSRQIIARAALDPGTEPGALLTNTVNVTDDVGNQEQAVFRGHVRGGKPLSPPLTLFLVTVRRAFAGAQVRYTFSVKNTGFGTATNVVLTVEQPPGTSFVLSTPPPSTNSGARFTWLLGTLTKSSKKVIRLTSKIDAGVIPGTVLTTTAEVTDAAGDRTTATGDVNVVAK